MSLGSFILIKNEIAWIVPHILNVLPFLDQMVFFDGNSEDGTLEAIRRIIDTHEHGGKIILREDKDPANLRDDYVRLFNAAMWELDTDLAFFLHPDMWIDNPDHLQNVAKSDAIALYTNVTSFAGNPGGPLYEIKGRGERWKNIYRLRNPNLGAHYHGWYGAANEDVYFAQITGETYSHYGSDTDRYPYPVADSGLHIRHFSDVRPVERRISRMKTCLINQGYSEEDAEAMAQKHPRVTLKDGYGFHFERAEYPEAYRECLR